MNSFLAWLEATAFSTWVRESTSVFAFPSILAAHTVGMGLVAGINAAMDFRILGLAPRMPLIEMKRLFPVMWFGFWLNAASGVVLLIGYPTKALTNPVFYAKLTLIALGLVDFQLIRRDVFSNLKFDFQPVHRKGKVLALASLVCWAGAITTGRFLAYTYRRLMAA